MSRHRKARGRHRQTGGSSSRDWRLPLAMSLGALMAAGMISTPESPAQAADSGATVIAAAQPQISWKVAPPPKPKKVVQTVKKVVPTRQLIVTGKMGLQPNAQLLLKWVDEHYPQISTVGGVRPDPLPDHPSGHALDIMTSDVATGNRIRDDLLANAGNLRIRYVIWRQRIYYPSGANYLMANRGSPTQNHYDHVHASVW